MSGDLVDPKFLVPENFPELKNDRVLKAAKGEKPDKLPVWIMRQAGRYLPEFRELRTHHEFFEVCETPALACEVTLMPIRRFQLDAAIIFSDILVIPKALGLDVQMGPGGPSIAKPLQVGGVKELKTEGVIDRLNHVGQAITLTRHKLEGTVPLFGFSGAPWTLMGYMIEGGGSKTLSKAKKWLYANREESHQLLSLLTQVIIDYLVMQVKAGAQILQVFDSSAEYLNPTLYKEFGLPYLKQIRDQVENIPMVLFAKGASFCLEDQALLGYEVIGVDWTINPERTASSTFANVAIQGNLDPCALYAPSDRLKALTRDMVSKFQRTSGYIVNLGHGIYPDMDPKAVKVFIDEVHAIEI